MARLRITTKPRGDGALPLGASIDIAFDGTDITERISRIVIEPLVHDKPIIAHLTVALDGLEIDAEVLALFQEGQNTFPEEPLTI